MSQSPDAIIRQWFKEVWDEGREDAIDRLFHTDGVSYGLKSDPMRGPSQVKAFVRTLRGALGDVKVEVMRTIVQDDMVAAHCRLQGRHTGDGLGVRATGRAIELTGISLARVQSDQIVEAWNTYDFFGLYEQLGMVPKSTFR
jgi:predicted ester cyclase